MHGSMADGRDHTAGGAIAHHGRLVASVWIGRAVGLQGHVQVGAVGVLFRTSSCIELFMSDDRACLLGLG